MVTAPRRPIRDPREGERLRVLCRERGAKGHDVEPAILVRVRQAGQEQVAPALVMAIQLAVRGDQDERHALLPTVRSVAMERRRQGGQDVLPGEPIRVRRHLRRE